MARVAVPAALAGDEATRDLYRGFGDTLARAFELVLVPLIFGVAGWALDGWLGTTPVFVIVLGLLSVIGLSARMWYGYDAAMRAHEAALPGSSHNRSRSEDPA